MIARIAKFLRWRTHYHVCAMYGNTYIDGCFTVYPWVSDSNLKDLREAVRQGFRSAVPDNAKPTILSITKIGSPS